MVDTIVNCGMMMVWLYTDSWAEVREWVRTVGNVSPEIIGYYGAVTVVPLELTALV